MDPTELEALFRVPPSPHRSHRRRWLVGGSRPKRRHPVQVAILRQLACDTTRAYRTADLARLLEADPLIVKDNVHVLCRAGHIRRVARGLYAGR